MRVRRWQKKVAWRWDADPGAAQQARRGRPAGRKGTREKGADDRTEGSMEGLEE
jgi:hypothetical protein